MRRPTQARRGHQRPSRRLLVETCEGCGQVLAQAEGCPAILDAWPTAVSWGEEHYWDSEDLRHYEPLDHCPACWAAIGMPHHWDCIKCYCGLCDEPLYMCPHGQADDGTEP